MAGALHLLTLAGLWDRHRGHHSEEGSEEAAAVQDLPVVPGQCVPRDEDVLGHHRLWGGKEGSPGASCRHRKQGQAEVWGQRKGEEEASASHV